MSLRPGPRLLRPPTGSLLCSKHPTGRQRLLFLWTTGQLSHPRDGNPAPQSFELGCKYPKCKARNAKFRSKLAPHPHVSRSLRASPVGVGLHGIRPSHFSSFSPKTPKLPSHAKPGGACKQLEQGRSLLGHTA